MPIELRPLGTLTFLMRETTLLRDTPSGTRAIVEFTELAWQGERLRATQLGATAGDWLQVSATGVATLDIRFTLRTDDGAVVFVQGAGRTDAARFAREGGPMYFAPRFETGDARYAWLNLVQAVGRGVATGGRAVFEVCEVV